MKPLRFYEHFACAYGTLWLAVMLAALLTQSHINTGAFGLIGFPIIALVYAFIRTTGESQRQNELRSIREELDALRRSQDDSR